MTEMHNFSKDKQRAIEQMLDMNRRAQSQNKNFQNKSYPLVYRKSSTDINPFFELLNQPDTLIILGLILILAEDNTDMLLLLALVYILS